jgi:hypothetical protein
LRFIGVCIQYNDPPTPSYINLICDFIEDGSVLTVLKSRGFSLNEKYSILNQAAAGVRNFFSVLVYSSKKISHGIFVSIPFFNTGIYFFWLHSHFLLF